MTVIETARFLLKKYTSGGDPHPTRDEHNVMIDAIENNAAMYAQGITGARPAAGKRGRFYWDETAQRTYLDDGANWKDLNPNGGGGPGVVIAPGVAGTEGVSVRAARADHTHNLPLATATAHGAMSSADKAKLDGATDAATASTLALRDANGRLSVNTPTAPAHATTKAYADDLLTQAADYTDAKVTAGPTVVELDPLTVAGYSLTGKVYVEHKGPKNRITVDINIARTGGDGNIPTTFASFGAVIPTGARGVSATDKYLPVAISGGSTNAHATVYLNTATGELRIKGVGAFTITNGATFSLNADYLVTAP